MLVLGLVFSISLSQITLGLLAVWLVLARRTGIVPRLRLPLALPLTIFVAWTVVAALASAQPMDGLATCKNLINLAGLWIVAITLEEAASIDSHRLVLPVKPPCVRRFRAAARQPEAAACRE